MLSGTQRGKRNFEASRQPQFALDKPALLAAINVVFGFCTGCFTYYQLARLGLIGRSEAAS